MATKVEKTLFQLIDAGIKAGENVQAAVTACLGRTDGKDCIVDTAVQIEAKYPVKKIEVTNPKTGKTTKQDANRLSRNGRLSVLRVQLERASAKLDPEHVYTVKKIEAVWQVIDKGGKAEAPSEPEAQPESDGPETSDAGDALWAAVELVLDNLSDPAVLSALSDGLKAYAAGKAKQPAHA